MDPHRDANAPPPYVDPVVPYTAPTLTEKSGAPPPGWANPDAPQGSMYPQQSPGYRPQGPPQGYPPQGSPQGYHSQGPPQGYPSQGPPQGYPPQGPPHGYPPQGPPQGYPPQGPPQGYPPQGPPHGYPPQGPRQEYPSQVPQRPPSAPPINVQGTAPYVVHPPTVFNEACQFGPNPVQMDCPTCGKRISTATTRTPTWSTHLIALVLCCMCCWPCVIAPYFISDCNNVSHTCPQCKHHFGFYKVPNYNNRRRRRY